MIGVCFPAKYRLDRSDTQDIEEGWDTQRVRIKTGPRASSKTSMITNHAAHMAYGPNVFRLLPHGILVGSGFQKQSLGYSGPDESVTCAM